MRWLLFVLLISAGALLIAAGGLVRHIWRHRRARAGEVADADAILDAGEAMRQDSGSDTGQGK